ncbi:diacylglycerol kinase family protein [soil metagenome]
MSDANTLSTAGGAKPASRPAIHRVRAVVNPLSGSVEPGAADALRAILDAHGLDAVVEDVQPQDIERALKDAVEAKPDLLILLAGDGTASLAATLCGPDGPLLAPLAGGTMNMLPHAVYGPIPWKDGLAKALESGVERMISGGEVDGRRFYVAAILGAPALWAPAREAVRKGQLKLALLRGQRALKRAFTGNLRFCLDGGVRSKTEALTLMCPLVSKGLNRDDVLEASALDPKDAGEAIRLGAHMLFGDWRNDPSVQVQTCRSGRVWQRGTIHAVLDGEPQRFGDSASLRFVPAAFRALALDLTAAVPDQPKSKTGAQSAAAEAV